MGPAEEGVPPIYSLSQTFFQALFRCALDVGMPELEIARVARQIAKLAYELIKAHGQIVALGEIFANCHKLWEKWFESFLDVTTVTSISPEDKYGPPGNDPAATPPEERRRWIAGDRFIPYRIDFWNKEDAPAPTQDVFVNDALDPNLDWATFKFTEFGFLRWRVKLEPTQFFDIDVDTRPDFNLIVNVQGMFDPETGQIEWQFHSLDPLTRQPPEDPFAGFLPPITDTGFEIGWVDFSVLPKAGLPTGTTIANQSFVKFDVDVFKPAPPDGPFINTLDADPPVSQVQPLAAVQTSATFEVQWSGTDAGAGIRDYSVFVTENGGPFTAWQTNTAATSGMFTGRPDTSYAFYSVARDNTGQLEAAPATTDSTTAVAANLAPTANAGADQEVAFGRLVRLDGSASFDDGRIQPLQFAWASDTGFTAGGQVVTLALPAGTHVFTLTVSDGELTATDVVTVTVTPANIDGISDSANQLLGRRITAGHNNFVVYADQDSGFNHGFPSGFFGSRATIHIDSGCIDDPAALSGCSTDPRALDRRRGTVLRITFDAQAPGTFAGVNIEEPENWGTRRIGLGYDLLGASHVAFDARSPNGATVEFSIGGCSAGYRSIPAEWTPMSIELNTLGCAPDFSTVHLLFGVATNDVHAPDGATVLLDNIRFEFPTSRQSTFAFPLSTETFGVVPRSDRLIPFDQSLRNLTTIYESALTELALLARGAPDDLANARRIADAFDYALHHDSNGNPLPVASEGTRGLHNGYESGDLALFNDQERPKQGKAGDVRLSGFTAPTLCPATGFCLLLDGATGGNNAFAILAFIGAFQKFGDEQYLTDATTIGHWIVSNLRDSSETGYGGYFLGYPDEGVPPPKPLLRGKSTENNADIFAALTTLAAVESQRGNSNDALRWSSAANAAGDYVMQMFDPAAGRFNAGTVPPGTPPAPGICPDGTQKGDDIVNTCDFIDSNTFTMLAMASMPRYRTLIDWHQPVQYVLQRFAQTVTAGDHTFSGFNIVPSPVSGANGIAWEFTAQAVQPMRHVDQLYSDSIFEVLATDYLAHIAHAQRFAPFGDGSGLVASTLQDGDTLSPAQQCLETPFQCIPQRVGLAATTWAMFAHQNVNLFQPSHYVALEPPTITVNSPTEPIYERGSLVTADYSCGHAITCEAEVPSGSALDTLNPGLHSFTIVATDAVGNTSTQVVSFAVSSGVCVAPLDGSSAWLPGDGTSEEAVNHQMATWSGSEAYATAKAGKGFSLDGASFVSIGFQQQGPFTVHAWVRAPQRLLPEFTGVLSSGGSTDKATSFQIELDGNGNYRLNAGDGAIWWLIGPALDFFQHVAVTFDGSTLSTFLNGQLVQRETWEAPAGFGFSALSLGIDRDGVNFFSGVIDEVQILNRSLSDAEIETAFLAGASATCRNRPPAAVALATPNPAEATDADGAIVTLDGTGSSDPDRDTLTWTWREGETLLGTDQVLSLRLSIGTHVITLTVDDGHGLTADERLTVEVRDTIAPELQITSSPDSPPTGPVFPVAVQATDAVGASGVSVNGIAAERISGTPQAGTWIAQVPIAYPVALGTALAFDVKVSDNAGNVRTGSLFIDMDGIPASMDRNRTSGLDESDRYSNDFITGWTVGSLIRNGWTARLSNAAAIGGVRTTISGAGTVARISGCTGAAKEVRLNVIGETADIACAQTGTIFVKAVSAVLQIELREQLATGTIQQFILRTEQSMSVGSPATASADNSEPITTQLIIIDNAGLETVVGSYDLEPGASVDVSAVPGAAGHRHRLRFNVLRGNVSVTVNGRKRVLKPGQLATMMLD